MWREGHGCALVQLLRGGAYPSVIQSQTAKENPKWPSDWRERGERERGERGERREERGERGERGERREERGERGERERGERREG